MLLRAILLFSIFASLSAKATVLVNPPLPYPQYTMGDGAVAVIDFAGNSTGNISAGSMNPVGYHAFLNTTSSAAANVVYIDVTSNKTFNVPSGSTIGVNLVHGGAATAVTLVGAQEISSGAPAACVAGTTCFTNGKAAIYRKGATMRLSFTIPGLCAAGTSNLCTNHLLAANVGNRYDASVTVKFSVVTSTTDGDMVTSTSTDVDSTSFTLAVSDIAPQLTDTTCPANFYFPGDGQIYFFQNLFTSATANIGVSAMAGADLQYLLAMANEGSVTTDAAGVTTNSVVGYAPVGMAQSTIEGFINTTTGADHSYNMIVQPQNRAGIIATAATSASGASCNGVQSQDISGILKESKCFIATAAYHDGRAAPVMMLRKFRDQVLSKFSLGQEFIKTYYRYSPAAAEWAWDKPIIRAMALKILAPIELMAWAVLKISSAAETPPVEESYTAKLKRSLIVEETSAESYSAQEKKKLEAKQDSSEIAKDANESYTERLKKKLADENASPLDYSAKEKTKLPAYTERESPISMVKEGRDHKLGLGDTPPIQNGIGIKLGVAPGMQVTGTSGNTFTDVYGTNYKPELMLHYERQLFHSENFGSFGLGADFGVAYSGSNGLLQFGFNGSRQSRTPFGFYQVPVLLNGTYRFNLMRILRPYITAGGGSIFYAETRNDKKGDKKGYSLVYNANLGVSLLLDFFDSKTHTDAYLSNGIQHTYLFLEYMYLNTFKSTVAFYRSGIYSGFLFEF